MHDIALWSLYVIWFGLIIYSAMHNRDRKLVAFKGIAALALAAVVANTPPVSVFSLAVLGVYVAWILVSLGFFSYD